MRALVRGACAHKQFPGPLLVRACAGELGRNILVPFDQVTRAGLQPPQGSAYPKNGHSSSGDVDEKDARNFSRYQQERILVMRVHLNGTDMQAKQTITSTTKFCLSLRFSVGAKSLTGH